MRFTIALLAALCASVATAQTAPGVTKNEIVIGTLQDLSGPLAGYGKQIRNGMQLRVDEANETGGINGDRCLRRGRPGLRAGLGYWPRCHEQWDQQPQD